VPVYGYYDFQNPPYMASRQMLIAWIATAGTSLSPYRVRLGTATVVSTYVYQRPPLYQVNPSNPRAWYSRIRPLNFFK
jgi:hypothetical protein